MTSQETLSQSPHANKETGATSFSRLLLPTDVVVSTDRRCRDGILYNTQHGDADFRSPRKRIL